MGFSRHSPGGLRGVGVWRAAAIHHGDAVFPGHATTLFEAFGADVAEGCGESFFGAEAKRVEPLSFARTC